MATAGQVKQQAFVFRYSSTALVASSTNSNALLDNTDNLKVGDKVIDSSGVLFSITAIDTQNSTFTIGNALIDLANDSDVVHRSGNETVGGIKTFTNNIQLKSNVAEYGVTSGNIQVSFSDKNNMLLSKIMQGCYLSGLSYLRFHIYGKDSNNQNVESSIDYSFWHDTTKAYFRSSTDNFIYLGTENNRWARVYATNYYYGSNNVEFSTKFVTTDTAQTITGNKTFSSINGVEPSSLSLPSGNASDFIDISSYFANTGTGDTNSYTASANGWIYLRLGDLSDCQATVFDANNNRMWGQSVTGNVEQITIPILKGQTLSTQWATGSSVYVAIARFIPCQGNV